MHRSTTPRRTLRSDSRNDHSLNRFTQLLQVSTNALSETADVSLDTKKELETAEILSLLSSFGPPRGSSFSSSVLRSLPLPPIHYKPAPQSQQPLRSSSPSHSILPNIHNCDHGRNLPTVPAEGERKRKRSKTTPEQLRILMEEFQRETMPNAVTRQTLAARLGMTPRSVQIWFQNMRAKVKKNAARARAEEQKSQENKSSSNKNEQTPVDLDGPIKKRLRMATSDEEKSRPSSPSTSSAEQALSQTTRPNGTTSPTVVRSSPARPPSVLPHSNAISDSSGNNNNHSQKTAQPPMKLGATTQSAFAPVSAGTSRLAQGKLPLPLAQHMGHSVYGVPLQFIPQSYHWDQLQRGIHNIASLGGKQISA